MLKLLLNLFTGRHNEDVPLLSVCQFQTEGEEAERRREHMRMQVKCCIDRMGSGYVLHSANQIPMKTAHIDFTAALREQRRVALTHLVGESAADTYLSVTGESDFSDILLASNRRTNRDIH